MYTAVRTAARLISCTHCCTAVLLCCTYCCTAVLMYVLLHCCSAVCSKGLVGGWVEGALRRPWWVGGPFCTWESFFCCFLFHKNQPTNCAPRTRCILLYVLLHGCSDVRTAALLFCCAVVLPCYYFVLLVLNTEDTEPICFCPPYRPATGIFREYH